MAIVNRRYAILGWVVWQVAKRVGKRKVREAVPGKGDYAGLNKGAIASFLLAVGGAFWLWRKASGDGSAV